MIKGWNVYDMLSEMKNKDTSGVNLCISFSSMSNKYDANDVTTKYDIAYLHKTKYDITTFIGHHILIALFPGTIISLI